MGNCVSGYCLPSTICCCQFCTPDYGWKPTMGTYTWIPSSHGGVPPGAVLAGRDKDGGQIYAGRAFHENDLLPAKVSPTHGGAFVAYGGGEHSKFDYEVLCSTQVAWQFSRKGDIPPSAIVMGTTESGEKLYMGRVCHDGTLTPGKIQPSHGVLYIPYSGEELSFDEYEVLVSL